MNDPKAQNPLPTTVQVSDLRKVLLEWDARLEVLRQEVVLTKRDKAFIAEKIAELSILAIQSCRTDIAALLPPQGLS